MTPSLALHPAIQPILNALDAISRARGKTLGIATGLVIDPLDGWAPATHDGWAPATHFTSGNGIQELLDGPAHAWNAAPHAAVALAWKTYTYWVSLPAVLGYAAARRVPLLHDANVAIRLAPKHPTVTVGMRHLAIGVLPGDPVAGQPGVQVLADDAALLKLLKTTLVDQHLAPLMTQLRQHARVSQRALWGSLASAVAQGITRASAALPDDLLSSAYRILDALEVADLVDLERGSDGAYVIRRRTCCLAFTVPGLKICSSCCLPSLE